MSAAQAITLRGLNRATLARQFLLERSTMPPMQLLEHLVGLQAQEATQTRYEQAQRALGESRFDLARELEHKSTVIAEQLQSHLRKSRAFGATTPNQWNPTTLDSIKVREQEAASMLPTTWVDNAHQQGAGMKGSSVRRGGLDWGNKTYDLDRNPTCAMHELIHWCEMTNPQIVAAEAAFYDMRTAGESLSQIAGYPSNETHRPDRWPLNYMGKDYGGFAFEVLSIAVPDILVENLRYMRFDRQTLEFTMGVLTRL